jgi:hypothetical protein
LRSSLLCIPVHELWAYYRGKSVAASFLGTINHSVSSSRHVPGIAGDQM